MHNYQPLRCTLLQNRKMLDFRINRKQFFKVLDWTVLLLRVSIFCSRHPIRSNFRVVQHGRFMISPVYPRGDTMVAKILDFRLFKNLQKGIFRTFCSPKLSLESLILHCLCENFLEYPSEITIRISAIVYLIPQHFSWFKNYTVLIPKLIPGSSFASSKTIRALFGTDLLLIVRMVARGNART